MNNVVVERKSGVAMRRFIITGAPSSGKSTLIKALSLMGHHVVPEAAREILETTDLKEGSLELQRQIEALQAKREEDTSHFETFYDRGLPDSLAYRRMLGFQEDDILERINPRQYDLVFLCCFGRHHPDNVRVNDESRALEIERHIKFTYLSLGCEVIELPWESDLGTEKGISKRLEIILDHISNL